MHNVLNALQENEVFRMISIVNYRIHACFCWIFCLFLADHLISGESGDLYGYTDVVYFRNRFLAVGIDGRIDGISKSGDIAPVNRSNNKLNCIATNDEMAVAAGDHGTLLYSFDGKRFDPAQTSTDLNINGVTIRNGLIMAGAENGLILISRDGQSWSHTQTKATGNILSLSSNNSFFIGVTDASEIMKSVDGLDWEIMNYNQEYAGYNPRADFKKILVAGNRIVIIGTHNDGSPAILISSLGNVWAERLPVYRDDESGAGLLTNKPNGITYDPVQDQFILACENGELLTLPNCAKCNQYVKPSENHFNAIVYADDCLCVVGADYSVLTRKF